MRKITSHGTGGAAHPPPDPLIPQYADATLQMARGWYRAAGVCHPDLFRHQPEYCHSPPHGHLWHGPGDDPVGGHGVSGDTHAGHPAAELVRQYAGQSQPVRHHYGRLCGQLTGLWAVDQLTHASCLSHAALAISFGRDSETAMSTVVGLGLAACLGG